MTVSALPLGHGPSDARQSWRLLGGALALGALLLGYLFRQEIVGAYRVWIGSTAFSHCFLVLPVALYLMWERRSVLAGATPQPDFRALLLLPVLSVAWLLAAVLNILEAQQFLLMTMVQAMLLGVLGWRIYRLLLGPFLYLYLLVPSGEFLVPTLQDITAQMIVWLLGVFHVPTFSDGIVISVPEGDFIVAEACAGLRFLIASIAFAAFFAMMVYRSWWRRAAFLALAAIVPIFANGIRAWGIIYLAHLTNDVTAVEADHIIYGWGFFSAIILLLIFIGIRFGDGGPVRPAAPAADAAPGFALRLPLVATVLAVALAALGPIYADYLESGTARPDLAQTPPPAVAAPWRADANFADSWQPLVISPDREFRDSFSPGTPGERQVQRYIALYDAYGRHNNLVRSANRIYDEDNWVRTTLGTATLTIAGKPATVDTAELRYNDHQRLVWYFYVIGGTITGNAAEAKLRQARLILSGRTAISAFVAIATEDPMTPDGHPERILADFLGAMEPLAPYLDAARARAPAGRAPGGD
ncbi:MAG TPA: exosortase A [Stellaceae bacterium]|jgi:exosortase A|nr:exosortase A [Stellaceae bacterium]